MELSEARSAYYGHSGTASAVARKAAYAGIAVVWVFNIPNGHVLLVIPFQLRVVALLLVTCLALDLFQYLFASLIWGAFTRLLERKAHRLGVAAATMDAPPWLNWPSVVCFWGKLLALVAAYVWLAHYIAGGLVAAPPV